MSLEQALADNTAALHGLTAAMHLLLKPLPPIVGTLAAPQQPAPPAPPVSSPAPSTAAAVAPLTAPAPPPPILAEDSSPAPTSVFGQAAPSNAPPPAPAAPPPAPPASGVALDSKGNPWDGRIHSGTKNTVEDGTWRLKRGVDKALVAQVQGELRAAAGAPPAPPAAVAPVAPPTTPAAPPAPPAVAAAPTGAETVVDFMRRLTPSIVSGQISIAVADAACQKFGVPNIASLMTRPDLVALVANELGVK